MSSLDKWAIRQGIEGSFPMGAIYDGGDRIIFPVLNLTVEQWMDLWAETEIERIKHDIMLEEWRREIDAKIPSQGQPHLHR